jgi:pre-mRNA-processing factor SLU7
MKKRLREEKLDEELHAAGEKEQEKRQKMDNDEETKEAESPEDDLDALTDSEGEQVDETVQEVGDEKYADEADMPGQKVDMKSRTTVRNLRIREDTANYLKNLKNTSDYDPKGRSVKNKKYAPSIFVEKTFLFFRWLF